MKCMSIDIETFSSESLQKGGAYRYVESQDFEILLFGYSVDGSPVRVIDLASGESIPEEILDALSDASVVKWAFSMFFVFLAWILFMSPDIGSAGTIIKSLFSHAKAPVDFTWRFFATRKIVLILLAAGIGSLGGLLLEKKGAKERISSWMERPYITGFKKLALLALFVIDILFLVNSSYSPFIYMQF